MGAKVGGSGGAQSEINVTPLVDIVLVLLIIFMVITPLLAKNIPIEVPQKAEMEDPPEQIKDQLVLKIFADQHIELNTKPVELDAVAERVGEALEGRKAADKILFFEAEDDVPYGLAVAVLDLAKGAGVETLGMMTPDEETTGAEGLVPGDGTAAPPAGAGGP
ncbi:MAG: biopolymer transporter ExbD [Myxococcota bacterium]|nr:biopolymer transporter ExbD [Myxococcota bacterium]